MDVRMYYTLYGPTLSERPLAGCRLFLSIPPGGVNIIVSTSLLSDPLYLSILVFKDGLKNGHDTVGVTEIQSGRQGLVRIIIVDWINDWWGKLLG